MRSGLLSLTLLGTAARGCFLRGASPTHAGDVTDSVRDLILADKDASISRSVRERRIHGKRMLVTACTGEPNFDQCQSDGGSALKLEKCLRFRQGVISKDCSDGLQSWKALLAATAGEFAAQNKRGASHTNHKKSSPFQRPAANRYNGAQQVKKISGDGSAGGGHKKSATGFNKRAVQRHAEAAMDRQARQSMPSADIRRARQTGDHHPPAAAPLLSPLPPRGEIEYFGEDAVIWVNEKDQVPFMEKLMADFVNGNRGGGRSSEGGHPGHPDHHHNPHGRVWGGPPGRMDTRRGDMGHHGGPRFTGGEQHPGPKHHGQQRQGPRPSMFSVLVDWIMGDSSSSDSNDEETSSFSSSSDSSSDDWGVLGTVDGYVGVPFGGDAVSELHLGQAIAREPMMMAERDSGLFHGPSHPPGMPPPPHAYEPLPGTPMEGGPDGGRDHIRSRNRLPEDLETRGRAWLEDSLDGEDIGPVEGILAFFFFIGTCTLLLLPFFLLGRALRKLVRAGAGGSGGSGSGDAPDGYQALPDDATTAVAAADRRGDDDDNVVVTGTPVNPPPSVHL
ncbi:unnamed protein product [Ectocarpus sp. CCAP 1310/34]|nr:unnamed protein product [Ectocarpus sp. CCAP 1310/34]